VRTPRRVGAQLLIEVELAMNPRSIAALLTCFATSALSASVTAQTLVRSVNGPIAGAAYGKACLRIDDQNGDGIDDLLVGAPGFAGLGAVFCISGAFPAIGAGTPIWAAAPPGNLGDQFGFAIADIGDVTGDGVTDYLVGQPGYDVGGAERRRLRSAAQRRHPLGGLANRRGNHSEQFRTSCDVR
jgi:hypothetical protein